MWRNLLRQQQSSWYVQALLLPQRPLMLRTSVASTDARAWQFITDADGRCFVRWQSSQPPSDTRSVRSERIAEPLFQGLLFQKNKATVQYQRKYQRDNKWAQTP